MVLLCDFWGSFQIKHLEIPYKLSTTSYCPEFSMCDLSYILLKAYASAARYYLQLLGHSTCNVVLPSPTVTQVQLNDVQLLILQLIFPLYTHRIHSLVTIYLSTEPFQQNLSHSHCTETEHLQTPFFLSFSTAPPNLPTPPHTFMECLD